MLTDQVAGMLEKCLSRLCDLRRNAGRNRYGGHGRCDDDRRRTQRHDARNIRTSILQLHM